MPQVCVFNFCSSSLDEDEVEEFTPSPNAKDQRSLLFGGGMLSPPALDSTSNAALPASADDAQVAAAVRSRSAQSCFSGSGASGSESAWGRSLERSHSLQEQASGSEAAKERASKRSGAVTKKAKELREILSKQGVRLQELERAIAAHKRAILGEVSVAAETEVPSQEAASAQLRALARQHSEGSQTGVPVTSSLDGSPSPRASSMASDAAARQQSRKPSRPPHSLRPLRPVLPAWAGTTNHLGVVDKDLVQSLYDKPYHEAHGQRAAKVFGVVFGFLAIPFGPIGMVAGGTLGALFGGAAGYLLDKRTAHAAVQDSVATERRLKSLVRWADAHVYDSEEVLRLIEMVTLEFRPIADMATTSQSARKLLRLLDGWISQRSTTRHVWLYMDQVLWSWRDLSRNDFVNAMRVFQVLVANFRFAPRELSEEEADLLQRMERLLGHTSVRAVLKNSELHPRKEDQDVMKSMVYADQRHEAGEDQPDATGANEGDPGQGMSLSLDEVGDDAGHVDTERGYSRRSSPTRSKGGGITPLLGTSPTARARGLAAGAQGAFAPPAPPTIPLPPGPLLAEAAGGPGSSPCAGDAASSPSGRGPTAARAGGDDGYCGAGLGMGTGGEGDVAGGMGGEVCIPTGAASPRSPKLPCDSSALRILSRGLSGNLKAESREDSRANSKDGLPTPRSSRKMQFFKSWDDFLDFDLKIKHRMPITSSEFDFLLEKEAESNKNWNIISDRKDCTVSTVLNKTGCITLRVWATMEGVDMQVAFRLFHDLGLRVMWDKTFEKMHLIDDGNKINKATDIMYSLLKIPTITARDFLQYRQVKVHEDGSILVVLRSAENPSMPDQKGCIRAESYIQGYVFRQRMVGGIPSTYMFTMMACDVKGMIPKWIVNYVAPRRAGDFVSSLTKASLEYQRANPLYKQQLADSLRRFTEGESADVEVAEAGAVSQPVRQV